MKTVQICLKYCGIYAKITSNTEERMARFTLANVYQSYESYADQSVEVCGWVRTLRDSKLFGFIEITDGTYFKTVQIVFDDTIDNFAEVKKLNVGAGIRVFGKVVLTPQMKQPFEIHAQRVTIEAPSDPDYPLQKKRHSVEYLREIAHLRPRTNLFSAIYRVRSVAAQAIHSFFADRGFIYVHTPIITASDCEGAGEMFQVTTLDLANPPKNEEGKIDFSQDFFGKSANLTVSGQLEAECFALAFSNVYTFGPTFRAEKSYTPRHAAEFWMIEPEIAFADLDDDMRLAEDLIKSVIKTVMDKCAADLAFFNQFTDTGLLERLEHIVNSDFERMTYTKAVELLEKVKDKFTYPVYWGCDLQTEHERYLTEVVCKKPVFVTDYPKEIKAFYMRVNDDKKTVAACDLLVPGVGEIIGGSQREERYDVLVEKLKEFSLSPEDYKWYLDLRKYGGVKHAGFGLGFERLIMYLTGVSNIRDVLPFPRTCGSAEY